MSAGNLPYRDASALASNNSHNRGVVMHKRRTSNEEFESTKNKKSASIALSQVNEEGEKIIM